MIEQIFHLWYILQKDTNTFSQVEQIFIERNIIQVWGYFRTRGSVNQNKPVSPPLAIHNIGNIANNP